MSIVSDAPRGGFTDKLGGKVQTFLLRNDEIEKFEDKHRGVFALWDAFFGRAETPKSSEVKDLLALGLVGAGMEPAEADRAIQALTPADLLQAYQLAQAVLGAAFMPDFEDDVEEEDQKKETAPAS